jgi:hypothetical protein
MCKRTISCGKKNLHMKKSSPEDCRREPFESGGKKIAEEKKEFTTIVDARSYAPSGPPPSLSLSAVKRKNRAAEAVAEQSATATTEKSEGGGGGECEGGGGGGGRARGGERNGDGDCPGSSGPVSALDNGGRRSRMRGTTQNTKVCGCGRVRETVFFLFSSGN